MTAHKRPSMREAAVIIEHAMQAVGCQAPVDVIDHNTAIRIGTFSTNLVVRFQDNLWHVTAFTPYMQRIQTYETLEACAHDIAMCEDGVLFHQIGDTEREIDEAIEDTEAALHV